MLNRKAIKLKRIIRPFLFLLLVLSKTTNAQQVVADTLQFHYKKSLFISQAMAGGILYTGLYNAWYKEYNTGRFHFFNDNHEWFQMDKAGHIFGTYHFTHLLNQQYNWVGYSKNKSLLLSVLASNLYFGGIELMDGFSGGWGFSGGDLMANIGGSAFAAMQHALWSEQKLQLKFLYIASPFAAQRPGLLGKSFPSKLIKDYNAQSYWLSVSPFLFMKQESWYKAFQLSFGYGANGMIAATAGKQNELGFASLTRFRQYMISLDIDWTKLPVKDPKLKRFLRCLNAIKIPLPQLLIAGGKTALELLPKH
jgi:hypothetical protein